VISSIHRPSLLDRFDEVLIMKEGRLVAQGSVEELALTCPEFQRFTAQAHRTVAAAPLRSRTGT
jgi:ABC-type multidrug transport system fused ATPase/permease subunit